MRFRYYFVVQDAQGNVVSNASVSVYLAGTTTPAVVYSTRTSSQGNNTAPQLYSRENGSVVFWLDSNDYSYGQLFDIVVQKSNFSLTLSDVQIIVWDAVNAVNASNADKLDGQDGSYYLNRANHTGTLSPSIISPQGSGSGLNADMLDGLHASQIPGPNVIVPLDPSGVLDLSATYVKSNVYSFRRVNLTNATSVPLHIATASNALYWLYCTCACKLLPNNATYSNAFKYTDWGMYTGNSTSSGTVAILSTDNSFNLGNTTGAGGIISYIDILNAKAITQHMATFGGDPYSIRHVTCHWVSPVSWTSLGTIAFSQSTSGYVLVRRLV